jgi:hypothetical protein
VSVQRPLLVKLLAGQTVKTSQPGRSSAVLTCSLSGLAGL